MADVTLQVRDVFPPTTSVNVYKRSDWTATAVPTLGTAPPGSSVTSATVASSGTLSFTGLNDATEYVAGAQISGVWTFRNFYTDASSGLGIELNSAQAVSTQSGISSVTDISGCTIPFMVGSRPVTVELFLPLYTQVTSSGAPLFFITDASNNEIARCGGFTVAAGGNGGGLTAEAELPAGTGAYTAKGRAQTTAGTLTLNASNTGSSKYGARIRAYES